MSLKRQFIWKTPLDTALREKYITSYTRETQDLAELLMDC